MGPKVLLTAVGEALWLWARVESSPAYGHAAADTVTVPDTLVTHALGGSTACFSKPPVEVQAPAVTWARARGGASGVGPIKK